MNQQRARKKKLYLINRDFQLRYALAAALVGIVSTVLTSLVILWPLYVFEILQIPKFLPLPILATMGVAAILNIAFVGWISIGVTHRIAGPMYSLVRQFRTIESGQWGKARLRLRSGDEMRYVARNFNEMVDGLVAVTREDLALLEQINTTAESGGVVHATAFMELQTRLKDRLASQQAPSSGGEAV